MPRPRGNPPAPSFPWAEFKHAFGRARRYFQYHTVGRVQRLYAKLSSISWSFTRRTTTRNRARNRRARKKARRAANNNNNNNNGNTEPAPSPPRPPLRPTGFSSPPSSHNGQASQSPAARQPPLLPAPASPAPPSSRPATPSLSPPPPPPSTPSPARHFDNGGAALRSSPDGSPGAQLLFEQAQRVAQPAAAAAAPPRPPAPRASHRNARLLAEVDLNNIVYGGRVRRQTEYYR